MSMDWFRWYHGTVSDPKLALIAKKSGQSRPVVIAVWAALLEQASQSEQRGDISGFDVETIAVALDIEESAIVAVMDAMTAKGMIVDGAIAAWEKRQPLREDGAAERAKAWREKQKQQPANTPNATERKRTQPNAGERPEEEVDKDTDTDTEAEVSQSRKEAAQAPCASTPSAPIAPVIEATAPAPEATKTKAPKAPKPVKSPIPSDWTPAETTYDLLEKHGIPRPFAEGCIDEFRLYWQERGESRAGWEATFVNNAKRQWEHQPTPATTKSHHSARYAPTKSAMTPEVAEFDAILRNLNHPDARAVIEGECHHVAH